VVLDGSDTRGRGLAKAAARHDLSNPAVEQSALKTSGDAAHRYRPLALDRIRGRRMHTGVQGGDEEGVATVVPCRVLHRLRMMSAIVSVHGLHLRLKIRNTC
jgi:hypothetical protein